MRSGMLCAARPTNGLAIQSNRIVRAGMQTCANPVSQGPLNLFRMQTWQQFAQERVARTEKGARSKQTAQQETLVAAPLSNRQR